MPFTTVQYIRLFQASLATGVTTQYTTPGSRQDVIKDMEFSNTSVSTAIAITIWVVPSGSSPSIASVVLNGTIPAAQTLHWTGTIVMNAGDFIATSTTATGIGATVSGLESQ